MLILYYAFPIMSILFSVFLSIACGFMKGRQIMYEIFEQLLQKYGVTAYKVSKETGITQSTLSDWKRGRSTPKTENMKKIADYFGVTVEYLMTGKNEPKEKANKIINEDIIVGEANGNIIYLKHCNLLAPKFIATFSKLLLIFFKIL